MGCSDAWEVNLSPEEAKARAIEEKREKQAREEIRHIPLRELTVGDLLSLVGVFRPSYPYHTWNTGDTDVLVNILKKTGRWENR